MKVKSSSHGQSLPDSHQSPWALAVIQLSGWTSLPILATSILILQKNSFWGAVLTIIVGNALLWFIRLGIIAMSFESRQSTLDLSREYLGKYGTYCIAILLLGSTLFWFIAQTATGSSTLTELLPIKESPDIDQSIQVSIFLGIISTIFCMGGIVLLRKLSTIAFPILVVTFFAILYALPSPLSVHNNQPLSLAGLTLVLATNLGVTVDLPTFFRHGKSWDAVIQGLTITQLISLGLGLCSLYLGSIVNSGFEINHQAVASSGSDLLRWSLISFIFISVICANVANVYSASVGWELVAPKALIGRKEYFILGLGLATVFILVSDLFSLDLFINISDNSLVNLSIIFIVGYIIKNRVKGISNSFAQMTYSGAWLLSTIVNALQLTQWFLANYSPLLTALIIIICTIFISFCGRKVFTHFLNRN